MVVNGMTMFVEAVLLTEGTISSVGCSDPLRVLSVDRALFVVCSDVLRTLADVLDITMLIVCDALSAAVKNELAISSPELVGSSRLTLGGLIVDEEAVGCTPGTMMEILIDRVESTIGSPVEVFCGTNPDIVLVEPTLLENEKLSKEANIELDDVLRE